MKDQFNYVFQVRDGATVTVVGEDMADALETLECAIGSTEFDSVEVKQIYNAQS
jgi:hypothetical protein